MPMFMRKRRPSTRRSIPAASAKASRAAVETSDAAAAGAGLVSPNERQRQAGERRQYVGPRAVYDPSVHRTSVEVGLDLPAELDLAVDDRPVRKPDAEAPVLRLRGRAQESAGALGVREPAVRVDEVEGAVALDPGLLEHGLVAQCEPESLHGRGRDPGDAATCSPHAYSTSTWMRFFASLRNPPWRSPRTARASPRIESAVSSCVSAPMSSPQGPMIRSSASSETPASSSRSRRRSWLRREPSAPM